MFGTACDVDLARSSGTNRTKYAYARGNPVANVDPTGEFFLSFLTGLVSGFFNLFSGLNFDSWQFSFNVGFLGENGFSGLTLGFSPGRELFGGLSLGGVEVAHYSKPLSTPAIHSAAPAFGEAAGASQGTQGTLPTTFENGSPLPGSVVDALSPYFDDFDPSDIRIHSGIPGYVVGEPDAYTSKNNIYFGPSAYDPNTASGIALIGHEVLHSQQYRDVGTLGFRSRYIGEYLGGRLRGLGHEGAYGNISFERDAFALQRRIFLDLIEAGYPR